RGRGHGLVDVLDASAFVLRPSDLTGHHDRRFPGPGEIDWLIDRHGFAASLIGDAYGREDNAWSSEHRTARSRVTGLRVVLEGSCLGPLEMGTQVSLVAVIQALAERDDVAEVGVTLHGPVPRYAESALGHAKVTTHPIAVAADR